ncbi:MAG: RAMP superfamily CRISPR-associated protein [Anaerolineae bacterium]
MAKIGIPFEIEIESALHVGQAPLGVGEYAFTQRHIPGSALRGALAEVFINQYGLKPGPESEFNQLFEGAEAIRFEPAYPATALEWGYPFPLTARQCKAHGGFPKLDTPQAERECYHGAFDVLVSQVVFEEQLVSGSVPFIEKPLCPHCWKNVEPAQGVYTWDEEEGHPGVASDVCLVRHTHTAINRARSVAEDGMLFTIETMEPGTLLRGQVWVEPDQVERVRKALSTIKHLGRGVTRGRGRVMVDPLPQESNGSILARIEALNKLIQKERALYARLAGDAAPPPDGVYFTLDLLSPAVFGNGVVATLKPEDLNLSFEVNLVRRFVASEVVGGWWNAARLLHPTALAVEAGSVFLYQAPSDVDLQGLSRELETLRAEGVGCLRERGYGAVLPCAPFHLWTAEKEAAR